MAKVKGSKDAGKTPNKALHSRVSYLYQAAAYLATQQPERSETAIASSHNKGSYMRNHRAAGLAEAEMRPLFEFESSLQPASRRLISDLRSVSLKVQIRMSPTMKHSICKRCHTFMVDGSTCTGKVENNSKGGKKPWADVLVHICNTCGAKKRFPIAVEKQKRRSLRSTEGLEKMQESKGR